MQKRTKYQIRSDAAKQRWVRDDRKEAFWLRHIAARCNHATIFSAGLGLQMDYTQLQRRMEPSL